MNAIFLCKENTKAEYLPLKIKINENTIDSAGSDGIYIKYLPQISLLEINENIITNCQSNGISLISSFVKDGKNTITLKKNNVQDNIGIGLHIYDTSCEIESCTCSSNSKGGISIQQTVNAHINPKVSITNCIISSNQQNGIAIYDNKGGETIIKNCQIIKNQKYGVYTYSNDEEEGDNKKKAVTGGSHVEKIPSTVEVIKGEISCNYEGGVFMKNSSFNVNETVIKQNTSFAIFIPTKSGKRLLKISSSSKKNKSITGIIGGNWGTIDVYLKKGLCEGCMCNIF